ncbi:MAG: hybrid sensor histidine kinase/response regulator [Candidatus Woesearchaeota archaeon]|jgi:two-component system sensor histidine kinase/response regulator
MINNDENQTHSLLVVEDDTTSMNLMKSILKKREDYNMHFAENSKQAIDFAKQYSPEVIIMDIRLPDKDGIQTTKEISQFLPNAKIIYASAFTNYVCNNELKNTQYHAFLEKPISNIGLISTIDAAIADFYKDAILQKRANIIDPAYFNIAFHDVKNLLVGLSSCSDVLAARVDELEIKDQELVDFVNVINSSTKTGYQLVDNIMRLVLSLYDGHGFKTSKVDASQTIQRTVDTYQLLAKNKNINLVNNTCDPIYVNADERMIESVFGNLITNAIKFTPEKGMVTILNQDFGNRVKFEIMDTGTGINELVLRENINSNNYISSNGTGRETGTGIGLKLCDRFLKMHGYNLEFKKNTDSGSTFSFLLDKYK